VLLGEIELMNAAGGQTPQDRHAIATTMTSTHESADLAVMATCLPPTKEVATE